MTTTTADHTLAPQALRTVLDLTGEELDKEITRVSAVVARLDASERVANRAIDGYFRPSAALQAARDRLDVLVIARALRELRPASLPEFSAPGIPQTVTRDSRVYKAEFSRYAAEIYDSTVASRVWGFIRKTFEGEAFLGFKYEESSGLASFLYSGLVQLAREHVLRRRLLDCPGMGPTSMKAFDLIMQGVIASHSEAA